MSESVSPAVENSGEYPPFLVEVGAFIAAVVGRMPALGSWWNLDDWGQLGRAAGLSGLSAGDGFPARWLTQHFWWNLTWPLFGLESDGQALARLVLHGLSAVLVTRIAGFAGLGALARLTAGLLFAVSPLAFTPLYWASGIQEILAAFFALLAVHSWLAAGTGETGSRRQLLLACLAAICSMLAKEAGLGLPLFFLVMLWLGIGVRLEDKAFAWAMVMVMLAAAVVEGVLVVNHFSADSTGTYATGGFSRFWVNLGVYGWWLLSPGPILASKLFWPRLVPGGLLFVAWLIWGVLQWRRGRRFVLLALLAALLALGPVLVLKDRFVPYLAYLAGAAGAVALVSLFPSRWSPRYPVFIVLILATTVWGFTGMKIRLAHRNELGLITDPVVRATSLSWQASRTLSRLQEVRGREPLRYVTIFQQPVSPMSAAQSEQFGERWVSSTDLYSALHGTTGPELILGPDVTITWASGLTTTPPEALVVSETATGLRVWGQAWNALLYAALTDIGLGHFDRARRHLVKAASLNEELVLFIYDEGQMIIPFAMVMENKEAFVDWTVHQLGQGASPQEVGGVQEMYFNLLSSCTGRSVDELTRGSYLLSGQDEASSDTIGNGQNGE